MSPGSDGDCAGHPIAFGTTSGSGGFSSPLLRRGPPEHLPRRCRPRRRPRPEEPMAPPGACILSRAWRFRSSWLPARR